MIKLAVGMHIINNYNGFELAASAFILLFWCGTHSS